MADIKNCNPEKETVTDIRSDRRRFLKIISCLTTSAYVIPGIVTLSMSEAYSDGKKEKVKVSGHFDD